MGAVARYGVSLLALRALGPSLPWGTLMVNVVGSAILGALLEGAEHVDMHPHARAAVGTGCLGAFTTYSTFSIETVRLMERGDLGWGLANVLSNSVFAVGAAYIGIRAVRWWLAP